MPESWLQVNLAQLDANLAALKQLVGPTTRLCAVVKADAYGLGAPPIVARLVSGVDMLAVYSPPQAEALLQCCGGKTLLIFMPVRQVGRTGVLAEAAARGQLHLSIHDLDQLHELEATARQRGWTIPVHFYLDTGMSRMGLDAQAFGQAVAAIRSKTQLQLAGVYTHFAAAEDDIAFTQHQMDLLDQARASLPGDVLIHAANTFGTLRHRRYHASMVRVGLGLYGYGPRLMTGATCAGDLVKPIMRWLSRIVHVGSYPQGATVGYNRTCRLQRASRLGVVPTGYGDGVSLALSNRAQVSVLRGGRREAVPVVGKINMDQIVIDLTDLENAPMIGDHVEVISADADAPNCLEAWAHLAGANCYELLCRLSARLPRQYVEGWPDLG